VAGSSFIGTDFDFAVARLTTTGAPDTTFDTDGEQTIDFGGPWDEAHGLTIDSLGRVLVVGYSGDLGNGFDVNFDWAVTRLTDAGAPDPAFDADGKQVISFGLNADYASGVAVDSAGRAVIAGWTNASGTAFALARLTGDAPRAVAQVNDGAPQR